MHASSAVWHLMFRPVIRITHHTTDTNSVSWLERGFHEPSCNDDSHDFMPRYHGKCSRAPMIASLVNVRVAYPYELDLNRHIAWPKCPASDFILFKWCTCVFYHEATTFSRPSKRSRVLQIFCRFKRNHLIHFLGKRTTDSDLTTINSQQSLELLIESD